jgi:hypothetical protein
MAGSMRRKRQGSGAVGTRVDAKRANDLCAQTAGALYCTVVGRLARRNAMNGAHAAQASAVCHGHVYVCATSAEPPPQALPCCNFFWPCTRKCVHCCHGLRRGLVVVLLTLAAARAGPQSTATAGRPKQRSPARLVQAQARHPRAVTKAALFLMLPPRRLRLGGDCVYLFIVFINKRKRGALGQKRTTRSKQKALTAFAHAKRDNLFALYFRFCLSCLAPCPATR